MTSKKKRSLPGWMKGESNDSTFVSVNFKIIDDQPDHLSDENGEEETIAPKKGSKKLSKCQPEYLSNENTNEEINAPRTVLNPSLLNPHKNVYGKSVDVEEKSDDEEGSSSVTPCRSKSPDTTSAVNPILVVNGVNSPSQRRSCYYGSRCYRKNPVHRADFAHPGDPDYSANTPSTSTAPSNSGATPTNDLRPLCEFGSACYRKNPQHRLDFRHDTPHTRKARPTDMSDIPSDNDGDFSDASSDNYDPSGSSGSDESFITSDSMSGGESDFDPEDVEENEKKAKKRRKKEKQTSKKRAKKD